MTYPANYAILNDEEMEYTTGGEITSSTITAVLNVTMTALAIASAVKTVTNAINGGSVNSLLSTVCGTGAGLLGYMNVANIAGIAAQIQNAYPEQYPEEDGTINGNLIIDSSLVYFTSLGGALMGLANLGLAAGYVYTIFAA